MRAIVIEKFGPPNVLRIKTVELPKIMNSDILVKVKSAGVNPVDTYIRSGAFFRLPDLPFTPGKDAAGIVEAVGENVTQFQVGQRVFICGINIKKYGTYAEYSVVKEEDLFPLDNRLTFEQGAALGLPYFTAYRALVLKTKCTPEDIVLVHGASGAVGLATVQLAKAKGLTVIGTAGTPEGIDLVKKNGADWAVSHKDKNYMHQIVHLTENKGVNIIIEMMANVNLSKDLEILAPKGRLAVVGSRGHVKIDPRTMMGPETSIVGVALINSTMEEWDVISKSILNGIKDGWVKPVIGKEFSLEEAAEAHQYISNSPGARGKVILRIES